MNEAILKEFNTELNALLAKYKVTLALEDVPATKKIIVTPIKSMEDETIVTPEVTEEVVETVEETVEEVA